MFDSMKRVLARPRRARAITYCCPRHTWSQLTQNTSWRFRGSRSPVGHGPDSQSSGSDRPPTLEHMHHRQRGYVVRRADIRFLVPFGTPV